jgi:deazaflavin-dependent oxidoreductase (nitroreductase family)
MASYKAPDFFTKSLFNPLLMLSMKLGKGWRGSRILEVPGRKSGKIQTVPVNPLDHDGRRYLVAPRGNTQWVRNVRAAGGGTLRLGGTREPFEASEIDDAAKPPILRAYLANWASETSKFFGGVTADAPDAELTTIAADHPVFEIRTRDASG